MIERISIEVTNRCAKACWFCYNHSHSEGATVWMPDELVDFVTDCAAHGVRAVSLGGGEPLQYDGLFEVLQRLQGTLFRSITTNGLLLQGQMVDRLVQASPDKVHLSLHCPERIQELKRVSRQVHELANQGIRSGVNLLVTGSNWQAAQGAAEFLRAAGIGNDRIVYLPMRGQDTPTPRQMGIVAGSRQFQSVSCLLACGKSPRFCSIGWDRQVAWCSYTATRAPLANLTYSALEAALADLGLTFCGGTDVAGTASGEDRATNHEEPGNGGPDASTRSGG